MSRAWRCGRGAAWALVLPLAGACAVAGPSLPAGHGAADYRVTLADAQVPVLAVALELRRPPGAAGALRLSFARRYAFVSPAEPLLAAPPVFRDSAGRPVAATRLDPFVWEVAAPPPLLRADYRVLLVHRSLPGVAGRDEYEQPYLASDHGLLSTAVLLLLPEEGPLRIRLRLDLPAELAARSSWPERDAWLIAPSGEAARNDLIPVGAWEEESFGAPGFHGAVLYAPGLRSGLAEAARVLPEVVAELIARMGGPPAPSYRFLFVPSSSRGAGGSPKATTMTMFLSPELMESGREFLAHLGAHEFFHLWGTSGVPVPDELRWFEEGVTDWVAWRTAAAVGALDGEGFARQVVRARREVAELDGSGLSLVAAGGAAFFEGGAAYRLCYSGGFLAGAWMDSRLADAGAGGLMPLLRRWKGIGGPAGPGRTSAAAPPAPAPCLDELLACFAASAGDAAAAELRRLVSEPMGAEAAAACAALALPPDR